MKCNGSLKRFNWLNGSSGSHKLNSCNRYNRFHRCNGSHRLNRFNWLNRCNVSHRLNRFYTFIRCNGSTWWVIKFHRLNGSNSFNRFNRCNGSHRLNRFYTFNEVTTIRPPPPPVAVLTHRSSPRNPKRLQQAAFVNFQPGLNQSAQSTEIQ